MQPGDCKSDMLPIELPGQAGRHVFQNSVATDLTARKTNPGSVFTNHSQERS